MAEPPRKRPRRSASPPSPAHFHLHRPPPPPPPRTLLSLATSSSTEEHSDRAAVLPIESPAHYTSRLGPPTPFQQPVHLTSFSYSPERRLLLDDDEKDTALAYYREPELGSDLNRGFHQQVTRDGTIDEGLDALLEA